MSDQEDQDHYYETVDKWHEAEQRLEKMIDESKPDSGPSDEEWERAMDDARDARNRVRDLEDGPSI